MWITNKCTSKDIEDADYREARNNLPNKLKKIGHVIEPNECRRYFFGRQKELIKMHIIQNKKVKNNILLVGNPGVGKTSLVEAFAYKCRLYNIFVVECAKLISNTEYRGSFEGKVIELIDYAREMNLILFFDEIHILINLGKTAGSISITDILKPYLSDEEIFFIGATTINEAKMLLADEAFKRRFTSIILNEPTLDELIEIKNRFEDYYINEKDLDYNQTLDIITVLRERLETEYFPDKLIDFVDYYYACKKIDDKYDSYKVLLEEYIDDKRL